MYDIEGKVKLILSKYSESNINKNSHIKKDLHIDSLGRLEVVLLMEKEFSIDFEYEDIARGMEMGDCTVDDIIGLVRERI